MVVTGSYNPALVALSYAVAAFGAYTALDLLGRVRRSAGATRAAWLAGAAVAMGGGIWSMHFIGMLAFVMPMPVHYDVGTTLFSLVLPILVTGAGLFIVSHERFSPPVLAASGLFMGLGIVSMHYVGMAAMEMAAEVRYDSRLVAASVAIAIIASIAALWLAERVRGPLQMVAAALVMGVAVVGMHYTGMAAATFVMVDDPGHHAGLTLRPALLAIAVATATFVLLFLALASAMVDRRLAAASAREAEALRLSERRFRSLIQNASDIIAVRDAGGGVTYASAAVERDLGYAPDAVVGRTLLDLVAPHDRGTLEAMLAEARAEPGRPVFRHLCLSRADGARREFEAIATDRLTDESVGGIVVNLRDVTERKRLEEQLRHAQKLEALGQLTGGVAHDFNNLLTVVGGNLELLERRIADERLREFARRAAAAVSRGRSLTHQLLAFSRQQPLRAQPIDLNGIVAESAAMMWRTLGDAIRVEIQPTAELWPALADPGQVETALLNLAVNARDAMPEGGRITIRTANMRGPIVHTRDGTRLDGDFVALSVADTGIGMPPEVLEHAFEPFFTTKGPGKGTGLGLSMVFGFAKQSGGHVEIESAPGRGTTVTIYLPRAAATPAEVAPPEAAPAASGEETILVVENDPEVRRYAVEALRDLGYTVLSADSGQAALQTLRERPVDLLFADMMMPGMDGGALAETARRERPGLKVLLTSGSAGLRRPDAAALTAPADFLPKPYDRAGLAVKIRGLLHPVEAVPSERSRHVLVVEDEFLIAELIEETLRDIGVETCGRATSAPEALALAAETRPDLALVDIGLARGNDGIAVARELQDRFRVPIVFLTGRSMATVEEAGVFARGFVTKPFTAEDLRAAIAAALEAAGAPTRVDAAQ